MPHKLRRFSVTPIISGKGEGLGTWERWPFRQMVYTESYSRGDVDGAKKPVRTDGPFVHYEPPSGASSSSIAVESSEQPTSAKRCCPNPPTPRHQTPSWRPSPAATAVRSDQEALTIAALVLESGMFTWVTEDLWGRFDGNVGLIRSGFQDIREQVLNIHFRLPLNQVS
ncbi:hypothetical protein FIBSPDRAFT_881089 [Athelia psychrophila]|uniref:Uncharacterized protein n=1 Tax=Athelia psychrophila TaxID=1759441 RepID=A0A166XA33_9AGAM|nr:hypothetical protein FIBSPDRAFT_881089 [Fibularhizoctonia sp. CBS 109695]